jgi:hypothetical protein
MDALIGKDAAIRFKWMDPIVGSPSEAHHQYRDRGHTISISNALKGNNVAIRDAIRFELHNAHKAKAFSELDERFQKETKDEKRLRVHYPHQVGQLDIYIENKHKAKLIVEKERVEYRNLIELEKKEQQNGRHSAYWPHLVGGTSARWSTFAAYLRDQCQTGHYGHVDPTVTDSNWRGYRFVQLSDYAPKDPML